jgi:hypothetical protein
MRARMAARVHDEQRECPAVEPLVAAAEVASCQAEIGHVRAAPPRPGPR